MRSVRGAFADFCSCQGDCGTWYSGVGLLVRASSNGRSIARIVTDAEREIYGGVLFHRVATIWLGVMKTLPRWNA